ncbi:molybdate ABC transporter substrate-binding protein [Ostreiculturibacter nitratireducens]|uniref:molybdate ABC transporter substrate-binding protein n=1 Tax=Ostreiculturibacter nitratireducens TaxID=3075226 RepID=UPI0031B5F0AD
MSLRHLVSALAIAVFVGAPARAAEITVFAAASLQTALDAAAAEWRAASGNGVTLSYAATSALARQIEAGAPADIFISASLDWMEALDAAGLLDPGTRRDLFGSEIVLVAHEAGTAEEIGPGFDLAGRLGDGHLAMAMVDSVPAGIYGKQALESLGLWDAVAPRVAQAENVRAALALVATGEAPYGIVYATDAVAEPRVSVVGTFPADSHEPIVYPGAVIAGSEAAEAAAAFLDWLATPEAAAIFATQGFTLPGRAP